MAFKNLEARYNEKVNTLYAAAKMKFDGGKATKGASDDPLVVRKPGDGYFGGSSRALGRALPISSGLQDVKRLTLFTISGRGIAFLLKQALLQTGNTFDQTRLINPLFTLGPAALAGVGNIIRMKRNLRPLSELIFRTDTSEQNVRKLGALQESTFKAMKEKYETKPGRFWTEQGALGKKGPGLLKKLGAALATLVSGFTAKRNIWDKEGYGTERNEDSLDSPWGKIRPEFQTVVKIINQRNKEFQESYHNRDDRLGGVKYTGDAKTRVVQNRSVLKYFWSPTGKLGEGNTWPGINHLLSADSGESGGPDSFGIARWQALTEVKYGLGAELTEKKPLKYISDLSNLPAKENDPKISKPYQSINSQRGVGAGNGWEDPITVSFAMARENPVRFRAFITDISQEVAPEYKTYQYVGRMEKFVTYTSVQRSVGFKLTVLAFSQDELDQLWKRINYLTGMVYPYGWSGGIFQPNIIRLTIGDLYWDQPGYFTSLNTNFKDVSWDIDREIPIGAEMDFKFVLIEKKTRIAQSPFYGITETMKEGSGPAFPDDLAKIDKAPSSETPRKDIIQNKVKAN